MCRARSGGRGLRHRDRRHGRPDVPDAEAAEADDFLRGEPTHPGGGLPEATTGDARSARPWVARSLPPTLQRDTRLRVGWDPVDRDEGRGGLCSLTPATPAFQGLDLTHERFVDLCILCGCDYTGSIKGIGPKKALNLIRQVKRRRGLVRGTPAENVRSSLVPEELGPRVSIAPSLHV